MTTLLATGVDKSKVAGIALLTTVAVMSFTGHLDRSTSCRSSFTYQLQGELSYSYRERQTSARRSAIIQLQGALSFSYGERYPSAMRSAILQLQGVLSFSHGERYPSATGSAILKLQEALSFSYRERCPLPTSISFQATGTALFFYPLYQLHWQQLLAMGTKLPATGSDKFRQSALCGQLQQLQDSLTSYRDGALCQW